jgi:hypothetical protein
MSNLSYSDVNPVEIPLTPMRVTWDGVDQGGTTDHCVVSIKYAMAAVEVDQFGKTPITHKVSGHAYMVKLTLAESSDVDKWAVAFPSMQEVVNGGTKSMYAAMAIGDDLLSKSKVLNLHPLANANADLSGDFTFTKAICMNSSEVTYGPDKQTGLKVEFMIYPDTGTIPAKFMIYGDPANGLVPATAAPAVPGSNTGNGTITNEVAYSGETATETITVICVGATTGNNFYVSGSVSGPLGEFHVAAAAASLFNFVVAQISFTLTQGSTQFAYGDSFTIATVSANYS